MALALPALLLGGGAGFAGSAMAVLALLLGGGRRRARPPGRVEHVPRADGGREGRRPLMGS